MNLTGRMAVPKTREVRLPYAHCIRRNEVPVIATEAAMTGCLTQRRSGRADLAGARALVAPLDLEAHALIAREIFEGQRTIESTAMEEIFLSILGGDETEAAFGDDLLYGTSHSGLSNSFSLRKTDAARPFEKE
jgi:hypothetical protein